MYYLLLLFNLIDFASLFKCKSALWVKKIIWPVQLSIIIQFYMRISLGISNKATLDITHHDRYNVCIHFPEIRNPAWFSLFLSLMFWPLMGLDPLHIWHSQHIYVLSMCRFSALCFSVYFSIYSGFNLLLNSSLA